MKFKKFLANILIITFISSIVFTGNAYAANEASKIKVISTISDGLRYYVVFEVYGKQFRSDKSGTTFNSKAWNYLSEEDKMKVALTYSYAPGARIDQFGKTASDEIAAWGDAATGWTEAGQIWEERQAQKYYPSLEAFYTKNPSDLQVGDVKLGDLTTAGNYSPKVTNTSTYNEYLSLINKIYTNFDAGSKFYTKLIYVKKGQLGNAIKAGSEQVIKMMVDGFITPGITNGASKGSELIAQTIQFIDSAISEMRSNSSGANPSVGTIIDKMNKILDKLESSATALQDSITSDLKTLANLRQQLNNLQKQAEEEAKNKEEKNIDNLDSSTDTAFIWGSESVPYSYSSDEIDEEKKNAEIRAQIQAEVNNVYEEYGDFARSIRQRKSELYKILDYDDNGVLTAHPSSLDKYLSIHILPYVEGSQGYYDLGEKSYIEPVSLIGYSSNYLNTESDINNGAEELIEKYDKNMDKLNQYIKEVETLIADTGTAIDSFETRINGLNGWYKKYFAADLKTGFLTGSNNPNELKNNLERMLMGGPNLDSPGTDYDYVEYMKAEKEEIIENVNYFNKNSSELKSRLSTIMEEYDSLYANLQNSGGQYAGSFNSLKELQDSPYLTKNYYGVPQVNISYINDLINSQPEENKEIKRQQIINELEVLRSKELDFSRKINLGKLNYEFDSEALNRLLDRVSSSSYNVGLIIGKNIITPSEYFMENINSIYYKNTNVSDIPYAINMLTGQSDVLGKLTFTNLELSDKKQNILNMDQAEFEKVIGEYNADKEKYYNEILVSSLSDAQKLLANSEYMKLSLNITEIEIEYYEQGLTISSIEDIKVEVLQDVNYTLPKTVVAKMSDGSTRDVTVTWSPVTANTNTVGTFTYKGTVSEYKAKVNLILVVNPPKVESIEDINVEVTQNDKYTLPKTVKAKMTNGNEKEVAVKWKTTRVNTRYVGLTHYMGEVKEYSAVVNLFLTVKPLPTITSIKDLTASVALNDKYTLPKTVTAEMSDGSKKEVSVKWKPSTVKTSKADIIKCTGKVVGYANNVNLTVTVIPIASIDDISEKAYLNDKYSLPKTVKAKMGDGSEKEFSVKWKPSTVNTSKADTIKCTGKVVGYVNNVNLTVTVIPIASIDDITHTVNLNAKYSLPKTVKAKMEDGSEKEVAVKWKTTRVSTKNIGSFPFEGEVKGYSNDVNLTLNVK